jgi:hypothetical protein
MPTKDAAANRIYCKTYYKKLRADPTRRQARLARRRDNYRRRQQGDRTVPTQARRPCAEKPTINALTDDQREIYEERAAIMEFDGGLSRAEAEDAALRHVLDFGF